MSWPHDMGRLRWLWPLDMFAGCYLGDSWNFQGGSSCGPQIQHRRSNMLSRTGQYRCQWQCHPGLLVHSSLVAKSSAINYSRLVNRLLAGSKCCWNFNNIVQSWLITVTLQLMSPQWLAKLQLTCSSRLGRSKTLGSHRKSACLEWFLRRGVSWFQMLCGTGWVRWLGLNRTMQTVLVLLVWSWCYPSPCILAISSRYQRKFTTNNSFWLPYRIWGRFNSIRCGFRTWPIIFPSFLDKSINWHTQDIGQRWKGDSFVPSTPWALRRTAQVLSDGPVFQVKLKSRFYYVVISKLTRSRPIYWSRISHCAPLVEGLQSSLRGSWMLLAGSFWQNANCHP